MNDNDDDVPPEIREVIKKGVHITAVLCSMDDPHMASKAIAVAIAHLLCYRMPTEEAAHEAIEMIMDDVDAAVIMTKNYGVTSWTDGTPH